MNIDPNAPTDKPETAQMKVIHKALRREFTHLPPVVEGVPVGYAARARDVGQHADLMLAMLLEHHRSEDRLLWPPLRERAPLQDDLTDTMEKQHADVGDLAGLIQPDLAAWSPRADLVTRDLLVSNLRRLRVALDEHLDLEEVAVLPLIHEYLTVAEWEAPMNEAEQRLPSGFRSRMLLAGAVLEDATPAERAWFLSRMPRLARILWRLVGKPMYTSQMRTIRGPVAARA